MSTAAILRLAGIAPAFAAGAFAPAQVPPSSAVPRIASGDILVASENVPGGCRVFDGRTGALKATLDHPNWTSAGAGRHVEIDRDGHIWVTDNLTSSGAQPYQEGGLYEFDADGRFLRRIVIDYTGCPTPPSFGSGQRGFTFGPRGTLFALGNYNSSTENFLLEIEPERGITLACYSLPFGPRDVELGSDGLLYVTGGSGTGFQVHQIDPSNGAVLSTIACLAGDLGALVPLTSGRLGVTNPLQNATGYAPGTVEIVNPAASGASQCELPYAFPAAGPFGLDVRGGRIYACSVGGNETLYVLDAATGATVFSFPTMQSGLPGGVASIAVVR